MNEQQDKRGAPRGDQSKPHGQRRAGTPHEGKMGNLPHERNESAAQQVEILAGFGLTQDQITFALERQFKDQGYSPDTLQRHYRAEIDRGKAVAKTMLMQGAYDIALGRNTPSGVSPDAAFRERGKKIEWLLSAVHDVVPIQTRRHTGADGGPIQYEDNIDLSAMTDDELAEYRRLTALAKPSRPDRRGDVSP